MSTSLAIARQQIGKLTNSYLLCSTTTNITTTDKVIDLKLEGLGFHEDDSLNGRWVWLNTTNNASVERKIEDHTGTTGALTIRGANLVAESASQEFELHKFKPSDIKDAINRAINAQYLYVFREIVDQTLTTRPHQTEYDVPSGLGVNEIYLEDTLGYDFEQNILKNYGGFENWAVSTKPDGSDAATGITLSRVSSEEADALVKYGDYACKAVISAATSASHYWTAVSTPGNFASQKTAYSEWVHCTTANRVKVEIKDNSGSTASTSYHQGSGWEELVVSHTTCSSPTSLQAGITCSSGVAITIYRDNAIWVTSPRTPGKRGEKLYNWFVHNDVIFFPYTLTKDKSLSLVGTMPLSSVSADTDTMEANEPQVHIIYCAAILDLYTQLRAEQTGKVRTQYDEDVTFWDMELRRTRAKYSMKRTYTTGVDLPWR